MVWAVWRTVLRYYHLWCAREDVVRAGLRTPAGVWVCDHCGTVVLSPRLVPCPSHHRALGVVPVRMRTARLTGITRGRRQLDRSQPGRRGLLPRPVGGRRLAGGDEARRNREWR